MHAVEWFYLTCEMGQKKYYTTHYYAPILLSTFVYLSSYFVVVVSKCSTGQKCFTGQSKITQQQFPINGEPLIFSVRKFSVSLLNML